MSHARDLRRLIADPKLLVAPGIYDALTATFAETAGFDAVYLSGASIAYTRLGKPDIGLVSMAEVADTLGVIRERVDLPIIVDADTGFGNALNVQRTVRAFERAGASAIQLEDQTLPKRCGHLAGKTLVSTGDMIGKIKAALDARANDDTIIVARTDAVAVEGVEAALERAERYRDAGADVLFVEAPRDDTQLAHIANSLKGTVPLLANMVEGGQTPIIPAAALEAMGYSLVIFPGALVRALSAMARDFFAVLKRDGSTEEFRHRMVDFNELNAILGTETYLELGAKYAAVD